MDLLIFIYYILYSELYSVHLVKGRFFDHIIIYTIVYILYVHGYIIMEYMMFSLLFSFIQH